MRLRWLAVIVLCLLVSLACSRDPNVVSQKYVESGNKYFNNGKYKEASIMYKKAIAKWGKNGEAYYKLGLTEIKLGRLGEAIGALRRAADELSRPKDKAEARVELSNLYLLGYLAPNTRTRDDFANELGPLADQLAGDPKQAYQAYRIRGFLASVRDRDTKKAVAEFRKADELNPGNAETILPLARALFQDRQFEEGERILKGLISKNTQDRRPYDLLYVQYLLSNRLGEAEEILKARVDGRPKDLDSLTQLAAHYYGVKRLDDMKRVLDRITSNQKDFPQGRERAGQFYAQVRNYDAAIQQYEEGIRSDPKRKAVYQKGIADALIAQGKKVEAAKVLEEAIKENPDDAQAKAIRASLMISSGDPKSVSAAVVDLQSAITRDPKNAKLRFDLARAFLVRKPPEIEQARTQLREAVKLRQDFVPPYLLLAQLHLAKGEYNAALDQVNKVLSYDSRSLQAKLIRTTALVAMGNVQQARADLVTTMKDHPNSRDAIIQMALLDLNDKKFKDAEASFNKVYAAGAGDVRGLIGLAETYAAQSQYDKAVQAIKSEVVKHPDNFTLRWSLANLEVRAKKFDNAIADYQFLIDKKPRNLSVSDVYLRIGEASRQKGDIPNAIANFRKAKDLQPEDSRAYVPLALLLDSTGQQAEARKMYEQILRIDGNNPIALNNLAYMLAESGGSLDQALTLAQRAKQKLPNDVNVSDTLGWIYIKKNFSDNAIEIFRDLVKRDPGNSTFRYHLAMALFQKGDKPEAKKELQSALQKSPSKEEQSKIRELMAKIG
jgi:tetratricopeptide (TPR) repeat protein